MPKTTEEVNKTLWRMLRRSATRTAIAESSGAIASSSNSASQSTESTSNSVALSKAFKKLNDIDFSYNIDEQLKNPHIEYIGRIEEYGNHRLRGEFETLELNETQWKQVGLAAEWAVRVHKINESSGNTIFYGSRDLTGNTRPFCLHTVETDGHTTLVIAFRATRYPMCSPMQMAVNTNAESVDCEELGVDIKIHRGLFSLAKRMERLVAAKLDDLLANRLTGETNLLFTGHSSGAAIAQLLFAFMHSGISPMARFNAIDNITCIDCVTFGGPPISKPSIPRPSTKTSLFISFINEGDPVPLAQEKYVHSLVQAYTQPVIKSEWEAPRPFYLPSGDQVVLKCEMNRSGGVERLVPLQVDCAALETILFGDLVMHSMSKYRERIQKILEQLSLPVYLFEDQ